MPVSRRRHVHRLAALLAVALALAGCTTPSEPTDDGRFRVALLSPGPVSDAGWNALAYEGLLRIRDELGADIGHMETKTPAEFEEGFRDFASRGFDLVFGHGFEFQDAAAAVAPDFPDTVFITTSGNTVRPNVAPLRFLMEEAAYLEGLLAGEMSRSGRAGAIGGMKIPSVSSTIDAFIAGARAARPDLEVPVAYVGNWEDVGAAKEAALAMIQQGSDFLFHNADAAALGVFQAAQQRDVYAFGANKNQTEVAPDVVLANAVIDIPAAFLQVARDVQADRFVARFTKLGMRDGVVRLEWNPALQDEVPAPIREQVATAQRQIVAGELAVPMAEF